MFQSDTGSGALLLLFHLLLLLPELVGELCLSPAQVPHLTREGTALVTSQSLGVIQQLPPLRVLDRKSIHCNIRDRERVIITDYLVENVGVPDDDEESLGPGDGNIEPK